MPQLTGQPIVTNYGKQQILASTADITKIKLGSGIWTPDETDTALNTQEGSVAATGTVVAIPAGGYRLHINGQDDSASSYDLHEFALTDDTDTALVIYSQAAIIDSKGSGSTLLFAVDIVIDQAPASSISISGDTTFELPQASTTLKGIVELATDAEAAAQADTTRAVTPKHLSDLASTILGNELVARASGRVTTGGSATVDYCSAALAATPITWDGAGQEIQINFASALGTNLVCLVTGPTSAALNFGCEMATASRLDVQCWSASSDAYVNLQTNSHQFNFLVFEVE